MTEGEAAWTPLEPRCLIASLNLPNAISCLILLIDALVWELLALDGLASVLISSMMAFRERFPGSKLYLYALVDSPVSVSSKNIWNEQKKFGVGFHAREVGVHNGHRSFKSIRNNSY